MGGKSFLEPTPRPLTKRLGPGACHEERGQLQSFYLMLTQTGAVRFLEHHKKISCVRTHIWFWCQITSGFGSPIFNNDIC